jgi:hypothetical protein
LGAEGRQFESDRPDQCFQGIASLQVVEANNSAFGADSLANKPVWILAS